MDELPEKLPPVELTSDTDNATKIPANEAPPHKRAKYKKFRAYNTGLWNGPKRENTEMRRRQDNLHIYDSIASKVGLTGHQKRRGRHVLDDLNIRSLGKPLELIAFAVCILVANTDVPDGSRYWPHPNATDNDDLFTDIADSLDFTRTEQLSTVMQVKSRTSL